jgi:hypothetical protein
VIGDKKHVAIGQIGEIFSSFDFQFIESVESSVRHNSQNENNESFENVNISKRIGKNVFSCHQS